MTPFRLRRPGPFAAYLTTQASWFFAFGLQTTLFPFVARNLLGGDEAQVGLAQTSLTAPALLLVLLAGVVAEHLSKQAGIISVLYPGADNHPQRALAARQMDLPGSIVTFEVEGGKAAAFKVLDALRLIDISNNLGDAKSLITHPASTTHQRLSEAERAELGISDALVRLSIGLEAKSDIIADLDQALSRIRD